jgi:probable addiction module antidote protein
MRQPRKHYDLDSPEGVAGYVSAALLTQDFQVIVQAIGVAAKARGMKFLAGQTGLSREGLYKALSSAGNPEFGTILRVLNALGLQLRVDPVKSSQNG